MITNKITFKTFRKNVATAGTAEQLPNVPIPDGHQLTIKARNTNTGRIEIGETQLIAQGSNPFTLGANESITLRITNATAVWIDATVNGEGIEGIVEKQQ